MHYVEGRLSYNGISDRYSIMVTTKERDLHCGDCFEAYVTGEWVPTSIEYNGDEWYLTDTSYRGDLSNIPVRYETY